MEEKESKPFRYNNKTYKSVIEGDKTLIQREDRPSPRASTTNFVTIGSYGADGKFTPTDKATDDEQKNNKDLVKESKKSLVEAGITESDEPATVKAEEVKINYRIPKNIVRVYPLDMSSAQDRMEFSVWEYEKRNITTELQLAITTFNTRRGPTEGYKQVNDIGYVYLPITKASDSNSVDWQDDKMSEIQRRLANTSLTGMGAFTDKEGFENRLGEQIKSAYDELLGSSSLGNMFRTQLAGAAVQVNNLLTRATGAIFNPNMELLFNGPQLRQFSFGFDLFAKSKPEADVIKEIIYFFKSSMSVRDNIGTLGGEDDASVFLNSPYVFRLRYIKGGGEGNVRGLSAETASNAREHKSIGKIKMCALQNCTVDYTPMGSYMTFNDEEATMVMYRITLQFKELTPIYASDYAQKEGEKYVPTIDY